MYRQKNNKRNETQSVSKDNTKLLAGYSGFWTNHFKK